MHWFSIQTFQDIQGLGVGTSVSLGFQGSRAGSRAGGAVAVGWEIVAVGAGSRGAAGNTGAGICARGLVINRNSRGGWAVGRRDNSCSGSRVKA